MSDSFVEFKRILLEYEKIPKLEKRQATLFDIMGNAHHENTCSNILSFFFDTRNNHGLEDLLIRALVKDLKFEEKEKFEELPINVINIEREERIDKNPETFRSGRIDLLIETDTHIICIENKIYHHCGGNPFESYQNYVHNNYKYKKHVFVLLNLGGEINKLEFQVISYSSFIGNIELLIGKYLRKANDKYLTFLLDCLYSVQKLKGNYSMTNSEIAFLIENYQVIETLNRNIKEDLPKEIERKINKLFGELEYEEAFYKKSGIWNGCCIYFTFSIDDLNGDFGLDVLFFVERKCWEVTLFIREQDIEKIKNLSNGFNELSEYLLSNGSINLGREKLGGYNRLFLLKESYNCDLPLLTNRVNSILNKIKEFNDNYRNA